MIVQNVSDRGDRRAPTSRSRCPRPTARPRWRRWTRCRTQVGFRGLLYDDHIGKVSLIGAGMRSHPGVSATFFAALADGRRQHRDDLHLGDPDLGGRAGTPTSTPRCGRCTTRSSWAARPRRSSTPAPAGNACASDVASRCHEQAAHPRRRRRDRRRRHRDAASCCPPARTCGARSAWSPRARSAGRTLRVRGEELTVQAAGRRGLRRRRRRDVRRARRGLGRVGADRGGARRRRGRQLRRVPDGSRRAAGRPRGQPGRRPATGRAASSPTPTAPRCR